jgi:hypothetical protein
MMNTRTFDSIFQRKGPSGVPRELDDRARVQELLDHRKPSVDPNAARNSIPLTTRLAIEIPKPKDWQAFQRNCVLLFRAELKDPHAQEYGRAGQQQHGVDILCRRNGDPNYFVGIQCRLYTKPLKQPKILEDARAALELQAGLKELIFATTAPDDTGATDAATSVERILRAEGHELRIVVYGWGQLQTLISLHEVAYNAFHPAAVSTTAPQAATPLDNLAAMVAAQVVEGMRGAGLAAPPRETGSTKAAGEDPALHARIDTFRDLFKSEGQPLLAEKGLLGLLQNEDLTGKPWARYRIETNLGAVAIELGREPEAAARFEAAHAVRRDDPNAIANLALARTIQGRFEEAMIAARMALSLTPRADHAVAYLLQAAARSDWAGDPEVLIPADLAGTLHADVGLAEYLRRRDLSGWAERTLELARRHQDSPDFKRIRSIAVLSLAIESGEFVPGGLSPVTAEDLNRAADDMKEIAEHHLEIGFADRHDLVAYINNAAVLLRLCERHEESEALLVRSMPRAGYEPQLRRLLALAQLALGRDADALATLSGDPDPENQMLRAELQATGGDVTAALANAGAIDEASLTDRLRRLRWRLVGEMALRLGNDAQLAAAVAGLRAIDVDDIPASLLEIRALRKRVEDEEQVQERLRALAKSVGPRLDMVSRYMLAEELRNQDLPEEASRLLEGYVDLSRRSPAAFLYLQSLASARRDEAFRTALAQAAPEVRENPSTLWTVAAHAWNRGDLEASLTGVDAVLSQLPDDSRARLLKVEILIRQDRSSEVFAELDKPLENLDWGRPQHLFRVASLLGNFGYMDRAAALAYRLFLQHRDLSRAWMTLSALVLDEGRGAEDTPRLWHVPVVQPDAAVNLRYDDGTEVFFVVEPDSRFRKLDAESWEPDHAVVRAVKGLGVGARFTGPDGRGGVISQIRHKYVARLHYVMEHHEARFPELMGFRRIAVDFERPGGLDALIAQIKARHDWIKEEEEQYLNGPWPLGVLAHRLGMDTIEVGAGLASHGARLKVAAGNAPERKAADKVVRVNARNGCVLDLLAFWTCWRLEALDAVVKTCGRIHLAQSVLDRLRAKREHFNDFAVDGLRTAGYADGKIALHEISPEAIVSQRAEIDRAIAWTEANAEVRPMVATDDLPPALREYLRVGKSDLFDSLVLAIQTGAPLVTDDLSTREFGRVLGGNNATWLHVLFGVALDWKHIDLDTYVRWSANLIGAGHGYLGVSGPVLAHAARLDAQGTERPGPLFRTLSMVIGGRSAEPRSHVVACLTCLGELWSDRATMSFRQPVTGHLLQQLVHERTNDYQMLLHTLLSRVGGIPQLTQYIRDWMRGHFIPDAPIAGIPDASIAGGHSRRP